LDAVGAPTYLPRMYLQLAPGLRVVRRGPHHLQVGLYDDRRVVLPCTQPTEQVLAWLREGSRIDLREPAVAATVQRIVAAGCAKRRRDVQEQARRRRATHVCLLGDDLGADLGFDTATALSRAGLTGIVADPADADVVLLASAGELARELTDPLVRGGIPHLVVRLVDGGAVIGPFVAPGESACLRCIDAQLSLQDPDYVPVLARYVAASEGAEADSGRDATEPALVVLALAWAVRDLLARVDGTRPTTFDRTVHLGPEPSRQVHTAWARDPDCGCSWPGSLANSGKMAG
jgi:bacteriocin biosynthesis cyclodehydratase domain-containing protein